MGICEFDICLIVICALIYTKSRVLYSECIFFVNITNIFEYFIVRNPIFGIVEIANKFGNYTSDACTRHYSFVTNPYKS